MGTGAPQTERRGREREPMNTLESRPDARLSLDGRKVRRVEMPGQHIYTHTHTENGNHRSIPAKHTPTQIPVRVQARVHSQRPTQQQMQAPSLRRSRAAARTRTQGLARRPPTSPSRPSCPRTSRGCVLAEHHHSGRSLPSAPLTTSTTSSIARAGQPSMHPSIRAQREFRAPHSVVRVDVGRDDGWGTVHALGAEGLQGDNEDARAEGAELRGVSLTYLCEEASQGRRVSCGLSGG